MNATAPRVATSNEGRVFSLRGVAARLLCFVLLFMVLQAGWDRARGSWIEKLWIQELTVPSATALINLLTPDARAVAQAARIVAPGADLHLHAAGAGMDVFFMLVAAFLFVRLPGSSRVLGLAAGLVWVFMLNQVRIAALFYALRADRNVYDLLHTTAAPVLMIALAGGFIHLWLRSAEVKVRPQAVGRQSTSA